MGAYRYNTILTVLGTVLLLPVAMLPILARVTRRYGGLRGWPTLAAVGLLGSAVALAAFTVFPLPDPAVLECTGASLSSYWQTQWFGSIRPIGDAWAAQGFPAVLLTSVFLQVAFNVALFVPYGFFLHQVTRWRGLTVVAVGLATSATIEITQGTAVFGIYPCPYRVLDVDDLIVNTLGAAVGVLISASLSRVHWMHPAPGPDLDRPTVPRRVVAAAIDLGLLFTVWALGKVVWLLVLFSQHPELRHTDANSHLPADVLFGIAAGLLVVVAFPLLRRDRATPGQVIVNVAPVRGPESVTAANPAQVLVRAAARWAPIIALPALGVWVVTIAELLTIVASRGDRSFAGLIARTRTRTKPAIASGLPTELPGGNMGGATLVGTVVRKPTQPQSATVQRLVRHVRAQGVTWPAEPLGITKDGNDEWRFIPGGVSHEDPNDGFPGVVVEEVARRLREWHDATVTFPRRPNDVWFWPGKLPDEVICHVDFAPYNHVFVNGRFVGAIDFDLCYPGPRLWDLAYTAYRYIPLTPLDGPPDAAGALRARRLGRLDRFLAAYAGDDTDLLYPPSALLGYVVPRLIAMVEWCEQQESADRQRDAVMYREHAAFIAAGGYGPVDAVVVDDLT